MFNKSLNQIKNLPLFNINISIKMNPLPKLITKIKNLSIAHGYEIRHEPFYPNLIGIRNTDIRTYGAFDDWLIVLWIDDKGVEQYKVYGPIWKEMEINQGLDCFTTDPGLPLALNPINPDGVGIVCPGFYKDVWVKGLHKGLYPALIQLGSTITSARDNNKDKYMDIDCSKAKSGYYGCNLHHAGNKTSDDVGLYSAMCQVLRYVDDLHFVLSLVDKSGIKNFNYTLYNKSDFVV